MSLSQGSRGILQSALGPVYKGWTVELGYSQTFKDTHVSLFLGCETRDPQLVAVAVVYRCRRIDVGLGYRWCNGHVLDRRGRLCAAIGLCESGKADGDIR